MAESYDAGSIVIQTYSAGAQTIQTYEAGAFVVPQAVAAYPVGALLDYYFPATSLALANLDPVALHTDVNTGVKTLSQAVVASQPVYYADRLGYPAVLTDGSADFLGSTDSDLMLNGAVASQSGALLLVVSGGSVVGRELGGWANSTDTAKYLVHRFSSPITIYSALYYTSIGSGGINGGAATYDPTAINAMLITTSGGTLKIWRNGTLIASGALPDTAGDFGSWVHDHFAIGGRWRSSLVVAANAYYHATGLAFGTVAAGLHTDPSALFAACTTEWGTP